MQYGPQLRYLLRVLLLLALLLTTWWTLLLTPLLATLRFSTELAFRACLWASPPARIAIQASGDWYFQVPVPSALARRDEIQRMFGRTSKDSPYVNVRSLRLEIPGGYPALFTVTQPFFWALVLAIRWTRRTWRALFAGTGILLILAVLLTVFEVIRAFLGNTHLVLAGGFGETLLRGGDFAALDVVPYLAPVLLALLLHGDLQSVIFTAAPAPVVLTPADAGELRKGRGRRGWPNTARRQTLRGS